MTPLSIRRWHASHLFGAWILYWVVLVAATLGRPLYAAYQVKDAPKGTASVNVSFGDGGFVGHVVSRGRTLANEHATLGQVLFWLTVPPLLLFLVWLVSRPRRDDVRIAELTAGDPLSEVRDRVRRERESLSRNTPR